MHEQRTSRIDEAIETLGGLVSQAGGIGDEALDVIKDVSAENRHLRDALQGLILNPRSNAHRDRAYEALGYKRDGAIWRKGGS